MNIKYIISINIDNVVSVTNNGHFKCLHHVIESLNYVVVL